MTFPLSQSTAWACSARSRSASVPWWVPAFCVARACRGRRPGRSPLAFVIGGVVAALSGYSYARLSATYPSGGGIHEFYRLAFGNSVITGWLSLLFLLTLITTTAMIARTFGVYAHRIIPLAPGNVWIPAYAAAIVILLMWVNLAGSRLVGRLAIVLVGIKMTVLAILLVYGLTPAEVSRVESLGFSSPTTLLGTVGLTFLAYSGYGQITNAADAVERPERTIPLALLMAVSIVAVFYVELAWVALGTVPIAELKLHADTAMAQVAHPLFGPAGVVILALTAMVSTSSTINAQLFSQLQMGARMARCGQLPASLQEGRAPVQSHAGRRHCRGDHHHGGFFQPGCHRPSCQRHLSDHLRGRADCPLAVTPADERIVVADHRRVAADAGSAGGLWP